MIKMVMFQGEVYYIHGLMEIEVFKTEETEEKTQVLFDLHPVEPAKAFNFQKCFAVPIGAFFFLPSSMDFSTSEWFIGVSNGTLQ
jgi:hypothetical protein